MAFTLQLDHDNAHDFIGPQHPGGAKPRPLTSSWAMNERFPAPPRATKYVFFLDHGDVTVAQANSLEDAYACCVDLQKHGIRASIRPYAITEETLQEDTSFRKYKAQQGF
jgi:hypothetical protein